MCAAVLVELSAITDTDPLAATTDPVSVRFKVDGTWTEPMLWFDDGAKPGQTKSSTFSLPGYPEEVMLVVDSDADTYGFTKLWITEECDIILVEDPNGEYIGSKAPAERSYDVGAFPELSACKLRDISFCGNFIDCTCQKLWFVRVGLSSFVMFLRCTFPLGFFLGTSLIAWALISLSPRLMSNQRPC